MRKALTKCLVFSVPNPAHLFFFHVLELVDIEETQYGFTYKHFRCVILCFDLVAHDFRS
jgi:hypothetical protein